MQVFSNREKLGILIITGNTTVQLPASTITVGAKQYTISSLVCDLSLSGAGGIDTGSIQNDTGYYIYAVLDSGSVKLIASLSSVKPSGFSQYKKIGGLFTDNSLQVETIGKLESGILKQSKILIAEQILQSNVSNGTMFTFNNLTIGKWYEANLQASYEATGADTEQANFVNGVTQVGTLRHEPSAVGQTRLSQHAIVKFQANDSTLTLSATGSGNIFLGNGNKEFGGTFVQLSELIDHQTTSKWD